MSDLKQVLWSTGKFTSLGDVVCGGQSVVIFAVHKQHGDVAVKAIETTNAVGRATSRFTSNQITTLIRNKSKWTARELLNMLKVQDHPGVVCVHDAYFHGPPYHRDKYFFIIMERADGDLNSYILNERPGGVTEEEARSILQQLVNIMCFIHSKGVMHRDIKAKNCLRYRFRSDSVQFDWLKITDFGFSKSHISSLPQSKVGTRPYAAPELLINSTTWYNGFKVDVWSLGVLLYFLLFGQCPFGDESIPPGDLNRQIINKDLTNDLKHAVEQEKITPQCRDLLQRMLIKDPATRIDMVNVRNHIWVCSNYKNSLADSIEKLFPPPTVATTALDNPAYYREVENIIKNKVIRNLVQEEFTIQPGDYLVSDMMWGAEQVDQ